MFSMYNVGNVGLRSLHPDDVAGVCDIFDPQNPETLCLGKPRHGFSTKCYVKPDDGGCKCRAPSAPGGAGALGVVALVGGAATRRARRRRVT
jgi:MYXO-CTERM domain-containing protein